MRVFIAISIVVASVSSASAQGAMDNRSAAEAKASAAVAGAQQLPSQQTSFYVSSGGVMKITSRTAEDMKGDQAAQAAWNERCQPTVVEDREGLRRVKYAERDCDLSRFNTAGH
jgi:hypothetical protein